MDFEFLLQGIPLEWEERRRAAIEAAGGYEEYVRQHDERMKKQMHDEFIAEMVRKVEKMAGSKLAECTFENFDVNENNQKAYEACYKFAHNFHPGCKGIMLSGNNGIGKNHLAVACCRYLAERMVPTFYASAITIKNRMYEAIETGLEDAVNGILTAGLVCINDLGAERDAEFVKEIFTQLVDTAYENDKVLYISTNLNGDEMKSRYGTRIMSRLLGMCEVVAYKDYDHRIKKFKEE